MSPGEERRCTRWRFMPGARRDRSESKCSISPKVPGLQIPGFRACFFAPVGYGRPRFHLSGGGAWVAKRNF
jgi:hypothetical protein